MLKKEHTKKACMENMEGWGGQECGGVEVESVDVCGMRRVGGQRRIGSEW